MKSEVGIRLTSINAIASDDEGGEDTPTAMSYVSYWGNTKIPIFQSSVVCVRKSTQGVEGSCEQDIHHNNSTKKNSDLWCCKALRDKYLRGIFLVQKLHIYPITICWKYY